MNMFDVTTKLVPVGYGIKKLQIMLTIVDDLVSVDNLIEEHLMAEPINEYVQSCDIVAFNKICKYIIYACSSIHLIHTHAISNLPLRLPIILILGSIFVLCHRIQESLMTGADKDSGGSSWLAGHCKVITVLFFVLQPLLLL